MNVNLGCHPWDVQALSFYQGAEQGPVLAGCKALVARGASVLAPVGNTPLAPFVSFLVKGNRTLMLNGHLSYAAPGIVQELPTISMMPEEGSLALPRLEHTIPAEGMVDITSILSSMPSSGGGISTDPYYGRTDGGPHFTEKVNISVKSSLDMLQGSQGELLWTVHNGGLLTARKVLSASAFLRW